MVARPSLWIGLAIALLGVCSVTAQPSYSPLPDYSPDPVPEPSPSPSPFPEPSPSPNPNPFQPIDVYQDTATSTLFILWRNGRPAGYKTAFIEAGVPLTWTSDLFESWSTYAAPNVQAANIIMDRIIEIISCTANCTTPARRIGTRQQTDRLRQAVAAVRGEALSQTFSRPPECPGPLPNSCPATLYGPNLINVPAVWDRLPGVDNTNPTIGVMVIDTGLLTTHVEFQQNILPGVSVDLSTATPAPITEILASGHGTHVAGTVFGNWNGAGGAGIVGNARAAVCKAFVPNPANPAEPEAPDAAIIRCINHALANGIRIINLSLGARVGVQLPANDVVRQAYDNFCRQGGIFAIAAGNDNINIGAPNFVYPAFFSNDLANTFPNCILTVAAVDRNGALSNFGVAGGVQFGSNFGAGVNIAAPGSEILSAGVDSNTATRVLQGTSMASPHIAGVMTLLWNNFPALTGAQVVNCIRTTATRVPTNNPAIGQGTIPGRIADANAAFNCLQALAPGGAVTITPRISCIAVNNRPARRRQVCLTAAQIATVTPVGTTARITGCVVPPPCNFGRRLTQEDDAPVAATAAAGNVTTQTFCRPLDCFVVGDSVCIGWRSLAQMARNPIVRVGVAATGAGGAPTVTADLPIRVRKGLGGRQQPGCVLV